MVNFVKVIAVQGNVVYENKLGEVKSLSGLIKLPSDTKLVFSQESLVVIQLKNGRIIKIKGSDLKDYNGELYLNGELFHDLTSNKISDLEKIENFATDYQNVVEAVDANIIRLDDGRVFKRVGKDYVEVAADTFGDESGGGNHFVQLARIGEDTVADGVNPLILNRVTDTLSTTEIVYPSSPTSSFFEHGLRGGSWSNVGNDTPPVASVSGDVQKEGEYLIHNIQLNKPSTGETKVIVTLTGNDAEVGVDTKTVEYSVDGGKTWILVTLDKNGSFDAFIPPNSQNAQVRVSSVIDGVYEENESYNITVTTETQKTPSTATGTILDIDPQPTIKEITSDIKVEGKELTHNVTLTNPSDTETTVTLTLTSKTADLGTDTNKEVTYKIIDKDGNTTIFTEIVDSNKPFEVVVPPYVDHFEVTVKSIDDNWYEQSEVYEISANTEYESTTEGKTATGTILDNEPLPQVTEVTSDNVVEGEKLKHLVTLNTTSQSETFVTVTLTNDTATLGTDTNPEVVFKYLVKDQNGVVVKDKNGEDLYESLSTIDNKNGTYTVTVPPGVKDFEVLIDSIDDKYYEGGDEQYKISAETKYQNDPAKGVGTIKDAQVFPQVVDITNDSKFEGNDLTHIIVLNNKSTTTTTVEVSIKGDLGTDTKTALKLGEDTGVIEYSTDGGKTWSTVTETPLGGEVKFNIVVPVDIEGIEYINDANGTKGIEDIQVRVKSQTDSAFEGQEDYIISAKVIDAQNLDNNKIEAKGEIYDLNIVAPSVTVYESGLPQGTDPDDTIKKATNSGAIDITVVTGLNTITAVNIGGVVFDVEGLKAITLEKPVNINLSYGTLKITGFEYESLESQTGKINYTFTLSDKQTHDLSKNEDGALSKEISFKIEAGTADLGSATASNNFTITIVDDVPIIKNGSATVSSIVVDETKLGESVDQDFVTSVFDINYGADGKSLLAYALTTVNGTKTGLSDTESRKEILLYQTADGSIEGRVGGETGSVAFTIEINSETGKVTLQQNSALRHPDTNNPNESISLPPDSIKLTAKVTDGDKDSVISDPISVGNKFEFLDDAPTLDGVQTESVTVSEKYLPKGETPNISELEKGKSIIGVNYGADKLGDVQFTSGTISTLEGLKYESDGTSITYGLSEDGHTITAYKGPIQDPDNAIFTIVIKDPKTNPTYVFTLKKPIDHVDSVGNEVDQLDFNFENVKVFDKDGDSVEVNFKVTVEDDKERTEHELHVVEDSTATDPANTSRYLGADVEGKHISILGEDGKPLTNGIKNSDGSVTYNEDSGHGLKGTVIVNTDGTITYVPSEDYSNQTQPNTTGHGHESDVLKYQITKDDGKTIDGQLNVKVDAVSDAPVIDVPEPIVLEDTKTKLGLTVPNLSKDQNDQNTNISDNPELLGVITLTLSSDSSSALKGAVLSTEQGEILKAVDGSTVIKVVIVDANGNPDPKYHHADVPTGQTDIVYLTKEQYESIQITPASNQHENLKLNIKVESYEVDHLGHPLKNVDPTPAENNVDVNVHAVTETDFEFTSKFTESNPFVGRFNEEDKISLGQPLEASFNDIDGSELYWYSFSGLPPLSVIIIDGTQYTANEAGEISATSKLVVNQSTKSPKIEFQAPKDFSGDLKKEIIIKLHVQDGDSDSKDAHPKEEVKEIKLPITLEVLPVAGDVAAGNVSTQEDTAVTFLENVRVTDTDTDTGTEVITSISFVLPQDWKLVGEPTSKEGWLLKKDTQTGEYTIDFDETLSREQRESLLDEFSILPPAHSSKDENIVVKVSSKDTNTIGGKDVSGEATVSLNIKVEVTPQAEVVGSDTDKDGHCDLTMNDNHDYSAKIVEDTWFSLNSDPEFDIQTPWGNQDGGQATDHRESTYAHFTAYTDAGEEIKGANFQYSEDGGMTYKAPLTIGGKLVIPVEYLNTVQFKGPENFKGDVKVKVEAVTVDYDEDDKTQMDIKTSGKALLTFEVNVPVMDEMTLKVDPRIKSPEDQPIKLNIVPTSLDPNETFDISISGIPEGAKIIYDGKAYDLNNGLIKETNGTYTFKVDNYDSSKPPVLIPPKDSNKTINLNVSAQSKDSWGGTTLVGQEKNLPINITLIGVPDAPKVALNKEITYVEETLDQNQNQVFLKDLITKVTTGETSQDGSENIVLRLSNLPEGFSIVGVAPPIMINGKLSWIVKLDELNSGAAKIQVPKNYSGQVNFTAEVIVTENDNASEMTMVDESDEGVLIQEVNVGFKVSPSPEAGLVKQSTLFEDAINKVNFLPEYRNNDTDETISEVRIAVDSTNGLTFYSDELGKNSPRIITDENGKQWYEINIAKGEALYVKGPSNFAGEVLVSTQYKVTDTAQNDKSLTNTSAWQSEVHTFNFKPVTDDFTIEIANVTSSNNLSIDVVDNQYVIQQSKVTLSLNLNQKPDTQAGDKADVDGSEHLEYILVKNLPNGVSVDGAVYIGHGQWKITVEKGSDGKYGASDSFISTVTKDIQFTFDTGSSIDEKITIEVVTRDGEDGNLKSNELTWNVKTEGTGPGKVEFPSINLVAQQYEATEDIVFSLADVVDTSKTLISVTDSSQDQKEYNLTVTLSTQPEEKIEYPGMTKTEIVKNGEIIEVLWTKTIAVNGSTADTKLKELLKSIEVTTEKNANSNVNNLNGKLPFDITVTLSEGTYSAEGTIKNEIGVTPVTDPAEILLSSKNVYDEVTDEKSINFEFSVINSEDQFGDWVIVGSKVYFTLNSMSGQLFDENGKELLLQAVSDVKGLATGQYFVIDNVMPKDLYKFKYVPSNNEAGTNIKLQAWVQHYENNGEVNLATNILDFSISERIEVDAFGKEHNGDSYGTISSFVELKFTEYLSNPTPNSHIADLKSIVLEQLPVGFSVWYSEDSGNTYQMANNAGGNGSTNTWMIPTVNGGLPNIYIQAPAYWSGTLDDLLLNLVTNKDEVISDKFELKISPIADGIVIRPNLSFGKAGEPIAFNINAELKDPLNVENKDQYTEYATLILSGFTDGLATKFLVNGEELNPSQVSFDADTGKFTLANLSQNQLDNLQFIHRATSKPLTITIESFSQEYDGDVAYGTPNFGETKLTEINVFPTSNVSDGLEIKGGSGNDSITGGLGNDILYGYEGDDILHGGAGNDVLSGGIGNDILYGGDGNDILHGGVGNDILHGGAGIDILYGGVGQDTFVWNVDAADGSKDYVKDFNQLEQDKIDVSQLLNNLGWDSSQSLSDYISHSTLSGKDTQLEIKHDDKSVSIVIENNTWTNLDDMLSQGSLKTDI